MRIQILRFCAKSWKLCAVAWLSDRGIYKLWSLQDGMGIRLYLSWAAWPWEMAYWMLVGVYLDPSGLHTLQHLQKVCRKWELWSRCCGPLLPASINPALALNMTESQSAPALAVTFSCFWQLIRRTLGLLFFVWIRCLVLCYYLNPWLGRPVTDTGI